MDETTDDDVLGIARPLVTDAKFFDVHVGTGVLERILGLSHTSLAKLERDGLLLRSRHGRWELLTCIQTYAAGLRAAGETRGGGDQQATLALENALLSRARREAQEIKNAELRAQLVDAAAADTVWRETLAGLRRAMLTLVDRVAVALPRLQPRELAELRRLLESLLDDALVADEVRIAGAPAPALEEDD